MATEKLTFEMNAVGNAVPEMKKVQAQLGSLDKTMMKSTANMNRHVSGMYSVARANKGMTRNLGMASLQFQDMAVQASMGTDALRIMTMQAPQLASIFGPKGMILGALIAVGGAIAMMGDKTTKLSFDFKKLGKDIRPAFDGLIKIFEPVIDFFGKALDFIKDKAIEGVNLVINAYLRYAAAIGAIPDAVRIMADNVQTRFQIMRNKMQMILKGFQVFFNTMLQAMQQFFFDFVNGIGDKIEGLFNGIIDQANNIRSVFGAEPLRMQFELPDVGEDFDGLSSRIGELQGEISGLNDENQLLIKTLIANGVAFDAIRTAMDQVTDIDITDYFKRVKVAGKDTATGIGKEVQTVADMMGDKFGDAFMSMVDGTMKAKDAFRAMAADIIKELYRVFVVKQITGFITNAITSAFPSLGGTPMKAIGGPVQRGNPYVVGERGPELFVPSRTGSIVPNDKMASGGSVVVNQTINVSTGVQQTVRTEIKSLMPQIAESAKAAVADAKRRGGSYGRAFA